MKKVYIVTGASGFLGSNIVRSLVVEQNSEVRALVLKDLNSYLKIMLYNSGLFVSFGECIHMLLRIMCIM